MHNIFVWSDNTGWECSTPFGDIDGCTLDDPLLFVVYAVLNAFRRH